MIKIDLKPSQIAWLAHDVLPGLIRRQVGRAQAQKVGEMLHAAYDVEQFAMRLEAVSKKEPYLRVIEEASGKFRALGNMLRAK